MDIEKFQQVHLQIPSPLQEIYSSLWAEQNIRILIKRDDLIHPIISGNKWRKLNEYIRLAQQRPEYSILSFGGAYSNHLYSLAYVGHQMGINTIGIVRGEELNERSNPFLQQISQWGMNLHFISREAYRKKEIPKTLDSTPYLVIPEGGYGDLGLKGMKNLAEEIEKEIKPDYLITAMGTGTTGLGLSQYTSSNVVGILTLQNKKEIEEHIVEHSINTSKIELSSDYIFDKYAKRQQILDDFCNDFEQTHQIKIEPIYTGRMFYGLYELIKQKYFKSGSTIVALHTGGIKLSHGSFQGNS
jgi:1-aminocyclopropane-1-carboxylate deaminase